MHLGFGLPHTNLPTFYTILIFSMTFTSNINNLVTMLAIHMKKLKKIKKKKKKKKKPNGTYQCKLNLPMALHDS